MIGDFLGRWFPERFMEINSLMIKVMELEQWLEPAKARRELNLPVTPVSVGVKNAYEWFKAHGRLGRN